MEGDLINYLIEISNNGPDTAQNVKVSELLNSNLKLLSFKATKGIFNNETKVLAVDSIASGEKVLLTVGAVATSTGYFENKVVVSSDTFDYDESNNQDGAYVNVSKKSDNIVEKQKTPVNYLTLTKDQQNIVKNSIQKSLNPNLESLIEIPSLATVELPKTGMPIVLLLLVAIFFNWIFTY